MQKTVTIGVDVRDLRIAKTGTLTYLEEVCREFKKMDREDVHFHFLDTVMPVYTGNNKALKWIEHLKYQLWKQVTLPLFAFLKRCDIVFCTDTCVPLLNLGYKTIPVFHDAFCFETPEQYGKLWLWLYKNTAVPAARRSPFVITPTNYAKKQINHFTNLGNEKLVVISEGPKTLDNTTSLQSDEQLLGSFSLSRAKYILHVGSMYKRKNIPALIHAFGKLKAEGYPDLKLVLAGPTPANKVDSDYQIILKSIGVLGLENDVILTGYLPGHSLSQLYQNALLYVFPSVNEGFGIPVLEAFKNDLPVLVADNTCLPEVGGDAVLHFNPFDVDDMALKIKTVLDDPNLQQAMTQKGRERLKLFSWKNTADRIVDVFMKSV